MSLVLQATGAAQASTRMDMKEMNVCNQMVVACVAEKRSQHVATMLYHFLDYS